MQQRMKAYKWLNSLNVTWDRQDKKTIYVAINGYQTEDTHVIEAIMVKVYGFRTSNQFFDKVSGKTITFFKHK